MLTRRNVLKGMMLAGGFCLMPVGRRGWALASPNAANRHIIMILMRGAVDGLSIVTPYMERNYYNVRHEIALAPPGQQDGLLNLDGFFGLNPSLQSVMPLWQNGTLAFIHASGSPSETRSHFEAQDVMETALMKTALAQQGWMNGLAQVLPDNHSPTRALSFGNVLPRIFQGRYNVATVPTGIHGGTAKEDAATMQEYAQLYGGNSALGGLYNQGVSARDTEMQDLQTEMENASKGAPGADAFVKECTRVGEMIHQDPSIQIAFLDVGGWDTHVGQGNAKGQLSNKLEKLGEGLAALAQQLGPEYNNTVIMVMSEFGRTVAQNGTQGTDHGHGNVAWLMGGGVRGGKVYSRWPGLNENQLWQGRDLAVTTDFRSIIGAAVAGQFALNDATIREFIPNYMPDSGLNGIIS